MEVFDTKFAMFLKFLDKESDMILSDEIIDLFRDALMSAKFDHVGSNSVIFKKKRLNGYNLFMREKMALLKKSVADSNARMSKISEEWNSLDETIKNEWREKARTASSGPIKIRVKVKKPNKPSKLSGYQVFVSEKMGTFKEITPKERMTEIGKLWRHLSNEQKDVYKLEATERNEIAKTKFTTNNVSVTQPDVTPVTQPDVTPVTQPDVTPMTQPDVTPVTQPDVTPVTQPDVAPVTQPDVPVTSTEATASVEE